MPPLIPSSASSSHHDEFSIDATGFSNPLDGGYFSVFQAGNQLDVNFVAVPSSVPETSTLFSAGLMLTAGALLLRRRHRQ